MILKDKIAPTSGKQVKDIRYLNQKDATDNLIYPFIPVFLILSLFCILFVIYFIIGGGLHLLAEPKST